jgi:hypothetical protein
VVVVYTYAQNLALFFVAEVAEAKFKEVMDSYEAIKSGVAECAQSFVSCWRELLCR